MTIEPTALREPPLPYRPCVGVTLINRDGLAFVGRRRDRPAEAGDAAAWQMPQGGIDEGEVPEAAAVRELYEETGVSPSCLRPLGQTPEWLTYDLPPELLKRSWQGRYRGQAQKWFAFGFLGTDDDIDVVNPGGGAHKPEFDAWRWVPFSDLTGLIVPFKRPVYEAVVTTFAPLAAWARAA
jgi:putative (di)nucleoside polyphosphate hydrolase